MRWVDDEAGVASQTARVGEVIVSSSPPPVPTRHTSSPAALAAGGGGSDCHACDPGIVTVGRRQSQKGRGRRH